MLMSRMSIVLTEERGNNPFSRFRFKTAIDHQDIDSQESDLKTGWTSSAKSF